MYLGMQSNTHITGNNLIPISVPLCGCKLKVASFPDSTSRMFGRWSLGTRPVNRKDGVIMVFYCMDETDNNRYSSSKRVNLT